MSIDMEEVIIFSRQQSFFWRTQYFSKNILCIITHILASVV